MKITDIKIGPRFRKELGDLGRLAASIKANGLLHPPVVTDRKELVVGFRRIKAVERLGWKEIDVRVVNPDDLLLAESDENDPEVRKDFTVSERVAIAAAVKERIGDRRAAGAEVANGPHVEPGDKTRDAAAKAAGFRSTGELRRAEAVVANGTPELVAAVDKGDVSVSAAAEVAGLPKGEQKKAVAGGPEKVKAAAKRQRQKKVKDRGLPGEWQADRGHPFADLLNQLTALSAALTKAMATEAGKKIKDYFTAVQLGKPPPRPLVAHKDVRIGDKTYGATFVGLRGLRRIIKLAGLPQTLSPKAVLLAYQKADDE